MKEMIKMKMWVYSDHWEGNKKVVTCTYDNCRTFRVFDETEGKQLAEILSDLEDEACHYKKQYYLLKNKLRRGE